MEREARLDAIITDYLKAAEVGQAPAPDEWLAQHPDLAEELRDFLAAQRSLERIAVPLRRDEETLPGASVAAVPLGVVRYFGDYELLAEIARGGMGVVFRARQVSLDRVVALKMILAGQLAGGDEVRRFLAEAQAAANLDHPNIVPIYEVGEHDGQHFFSMKLIEGGSLAERSTQCQEGKTTWRREAVHLIEQVARAVHHAHQRGVLHRDLKPANILLDAQRVPYVTDFGLARRVEGDKGLTRTGAIVGTPSYMAPEQARGDRSLSVAADVYSLGAVLYECLTGRPPFRAASVMDTLLQVLEREPDRPSALVSGVDRDVETICLKCLEKDPARRYESAAALADDLERWRLGEPIAARPVGSTARLWRWCRRRPALAATLVMLVLALLATTAISTLAYVRIAAARDGERQALRRAHGRRLTALAESVRPANPGLALLLAIEGAQRAPEELADLALRSALDACAERRAFQGHTDTVFAAWFRKGGSEVFTLSDDRTARLWDVTTGKSVRHIHGDKVRVNILSHAGTWESVLGLANAILTAVDTPTGLLLLAQTEKGFVVWDEAGRTVSRIEHQPRGVYGVLSPRSPVAVFSPDGSKVVIVFGQREPPEETVFAVATGKPLYVLRGHAQHIQYARFSPDGSRLVTCAQDHTARVWDAATGKHLATFTGHTSDPGYVAFSPDGKRAVTLGWLRADGNVAGRIWEVATGKELGRLEGMKDSQVTVGQAFFSPDGSRVITCQVRIQVGLVGPEQLSDLCVWDGFTGKRQHRLLVRPDDDYRCRALVAAMHARYLAAGGEDGIVRLCDLGNGQVRELRGHTGPIQDVTFHPQGEMLLTASKDGTARLWDLRTGVGQTVWNQVRGVTPSPDGRRLLLTFAGSKAPLLFDCPTGRSKELPGHPSWIDIAAFTADGQRALTTSMNTVYVWDVATGQRLAQRAHEGQMIDVAAFTPNGKEIFAMSRGGPPRFWDIASNKERRLASPVGINSVQTALFTPDGTGMLTTIRRLVPPLYSGNSRQPELWDVASGKHRHTFEDDREYKADRFLTVQGETSFAVLSPDGTRVLTGSSNRTARLWDAASGQRQAQLVGHTDAVTWGAFAPDGRSVATASGDGTLRLWEVDTGVCRHTFRGHEAGVSCVHFSRSGDRLISAALDRTVRLWDIATGRLLGVIALPPGRDTPFATFLDAQHVLTLASGTARIHVADALEEARRLQPRDFTPAERAKYEVEER